MAAAVSAVSTSVSTAVSTSRPPNASESVVIECSKASSPWTVATTKRAQSTATKPLARVRDAMTERGRACRQTWPDDDCRKSPPAGETTGRAASQRILTNEKRTDSLPPCELAVDIAVQRSTAQEVCTPLALCTNLRPGMPWPFGNQPAARKVRATPRAGGAEYTAAAPGARAPPVVARAPARSWRQQKKIGRLKPCRRADAFQRGTNPAPAVPTLQPPGVSAQLTRRAPKAGRQPQAESSQCFPEL